MSKRIFTVILALVLSLTALSFGAEAEWTGAQLVYNEAEKTLTFSWTEYEGAAKYTATIYNSSNTAVRTQTYIKVDERVTTELTCGNPAGGKYYGKVTAYNEDGIELDSCISGDVIVPAVVTNNGITITLGADGSVVVSWNPVTAAVAYIVDVYYRDADNKAQTMSHNVGAATSHTINYADYDKLTSITVYYQDSALNKRTIGTVYPASNNGGSVNQGNGNGNVYLDYDTGCVRWISQGDQPHYVRAYLIGGNPLGEMDCGTAGYCDVSSLLRQYYNQVIYFSVYTTISGYTQNIGTAVYNPNYTDKYYSSGIGYTFTVTVSGSVANIDWSYYQNRGNTVSQYLINYVINGEKKSVVLDGSETSIDLQWAGGLMVDVMVFNGSLYLTIGNATVDKDGTVIYGVRPNEGNIFGDNCVMSVGTYSSSVTWASVEGTSYYTVISTDNTTGRVSYYNTTFTYASIPLGYSVNTDFSVRVLAYTSNGQPSIVASVDYKGTSSGQTPTPTPTVCEHTFEYQSCTEVHWKHCTKCGYTCEVGEHSAANGSCSVCGRSSTTSRFDVNGNGHVDLQDAVMILRRLAHLD